MVLFEFVSSFTHDTLPSTPCAPYTVEQHVLQKEAALARALNHLIIVASVMNCVPTRTMTHELEG